MKNEEIFNLKNEFNKRVNNLIDGNHFRIKQLSNFMKFYSEDKKSIVDCFKETFYKVKGEIPKIMFECLTDVISSTFYKDNKKEDSYHVLFSQLLFHEFYWMVKKFRTKKQIEIIEKLIISWSEKKWGPCKQAIYLNEFTDFLLAILQDHKINMDNESYNQNLDDIIIDNYLTEKSNSFIINGLKNPLIKQYFNIYLNDKILESQYGENVSKDEFIGLLSNNNPNLMRRKNGIVKKFKPVFSTLKNKLMEQIVRRELFLKQLIENRDKIYSEYVENLKEK